MGRKHKVSEYELTMIKKLTDKGFTIKEIAIEMGRPRTTIAYHIRQFRGGYLYHHLTPNEIQDIRRLYFDEKKSIYAIGKLIKRHQKTIWQCVQKYGKVRTYSEAQLLANKLGHGQGIKNKGQANGMWQGGRHKLSAGYIRIILPDDGFPIMGNKEGYVLEHRYVMAKHLNRPLNRDEMVHHLNGIKDDNRIFNLAVVSRNNHPTKTLMKQFQKRIRDLETELSQQKLCM